MKLAAHSLRDVVTTEGVILRTAVAALVTSVAALVGGLAAPPNGFGTRQIAIEASGTVVRCCVELPARVAPARITGLLVVQSIHNLRF